MRYIRASATGPPYLPPKSYWPLTISHKFTRSNVLVHETFMVEPSVNILVPVAMGVRNSPLGFGITVGFKGEYRL